MPAAQRILGGYVHGGSIPADKALVIESVDVYATAAGDSNGHGELKLKIGGRTLLKLYDQKGPFLNWYSGAVVVRPSEEHTIELGAANSSSADVRIRGRLVPLNQAGAVQTRPLALGEPPQGVKRAGGGDPKARSHLLLQPNAVLQVRAGAGGGNPNRIDLSGKKSIYIRRISDEQLSFDKPVRMKERAVAFYDGGLIPKNKVFVVTQVTYAGTAAGDTNGPGEFLVSIGGTKIVHERNKPGPIRGQWQGRIEIAPGQENTVYLEVANSSTGNVKIHGRFADRK